MTAPSLPDVADTGTIISTSQSDWRAILIFVMFMFVSQLVFIAWREFGLSRLSKAIDKVSESLWGLRLTITQDRADTEKRAVAASHEWAMAEKERKCSDVERERVTAIEKGVAAATARERKAAGAERRRQGKERRRLLEREEELLATHKAERTEQTVERNKQGVERHDQGVERQEQGVERVEQGKARAERRNHRD